MSRLSTLLNVTGQPGQEGSLGAGGYIIRTVKSLWSPPETVTTLLVD